MKFYRNNYYVLIKDIKLERLKETFTRFSRNDFINRRHDFASKINKLFFDVTNSDSQSSIEQMDDLNRLISDIKASLTPLNEKIVNLSNHIRYEMSGERLQLKVNALEKWADYGWTINNELSIEDVYNPPDSQLEADRLVMSVFDLESMLDDLDNIKKNLFIDEAMIDDIKLLFKMERFSSCIAITLNAIDRIKISHMKFDLKTGKFDYNFFKESLKKSKPSFTKLDELKDYHITYLLAHNTLKLFRRTFQTSANDWINEPDYIVRDFVNHGMSNHFWGRIDAIKMISLLNTFSDLSMLVIKEVLIKK